MNAEVIDFDTATKDDLITWLEKNYPDTKFDKRKSPEALATLCKKLTGDEDGDGDGDGEDEDDKPTKAGRRPKALPAGVSHLKHRENGRVFKATQELWKRGDMDACNEKGKLSDGAY